MPERHDPVADLFGPGEPRSAGAEKPGRNAAESRGRAARALEAGDPTGALVHLRRALDQAEPAERAQTLVDLGGVHEVLDQGPAALRRHAEAAKLGSAGCEPLLGVSDLYRRQGRLREALGPLERSIELEPGNAYLRMKLAVALREMGEPERALASCRAASALAPEEPFYRFWAGDLLVTMRRDVEALEALREAIALFPGDQHFYVRAGVAYWRTGRPLEAMKAIRLASELDPEKHAYHGMLEAMLLALDRDDEADLEADRADRMDRYDHAVLAAFLAELGLES